MSNRLPSNRKSIIFFQKKFLTVQEWTGKIPPACDQAPVARQKAAFQEKEEKTRTLVSIGEIPKLLYSLLEEMRLIAYTKITIVTNNSQLKIFEESSWQTL